MNDVIIERSGSNLFVFFLATKAAEEWVAENVEVPDYMWMGTNSFGCDYGMAGELASNMVAAGLEVA